MDAKSGAGRSILTTVLTFALATIAMAAGASMNEATPTPPAVSGSPVAEVHDERRGASGSHGGIVERVHDAAGCDLVDVSTLQGNWNHGDYVSAVAKSGSHQDVRAAAQSDCGKPLVATEHGNAGGSVPEEAQQHADEGQAHAVGPPAQAGPPASAGSSGQTPGGS